MQNSLQKLPPQNLEAEQRALAAMLISEDAVVRATDLIHDEDFYSDKHRTIYRAIVDCFQGEGRSDLVAISEWLRTKQELESTGGATYLAYLTTVTPTAANIRRDLAIVKERAIYRRVINWATEIDAQAFSGVENMREWFARMQYGLLELSSAVKEKKSPRIPDVLLDLESQWNEFKKANDSKANVATGKYCEVDLMRGATSNPIPYFMPGHLWMLAGYTSAGKSTTLAQFLCDACQRGAKVLIFSLEESRTTKAVKMIANLTDIPQRYLLTGEISKDQRTKEAIEYAWGKLREWNLIIYDDVRTLDEISLKIKKHAMQDGVDIVAIDYVQNIIGDGQSIYQDMRLVGPTLLDLSIELGITTVALSQVTNESVREDSQIIGLKGAGELAAAADIVLWLKRIKGDPRALDCEIRKNRPFGETSIVPMTFSERYTQVQRRL